MPPYVQRKKIRVETKTFISKRRKRWYIRSSLKEIVNFVFNKPTQETRKTQLSKLILQKKGDAEKKNKPKKLASK